MLLNSIGNEPGMKSIVFLASGKLPTTAIGMAFDFWIFFPFFFFFFFFVVFLFFFFHLIYEKGHHTWKKSPCKYNNTILYKIGMPILHLFLIAH